MSAPFRFWTFYGLVRITGDRADTPGALRDLIAQCPPACLFFHTFQVVRDRHFARDQYPNDFAEWVLTSVGDEALAERLAGLDVRMFRSIDELREQTLAVFDHHFKLHPRANGREARAGPRPLDVLFSKGILRVLKPGRPRAYGAIKAPGVHSTARVGLSRCAAGGLGRRLHILAPAVLPGSCPHSRASFPAYA